MGKRSKLDKFNQFLNILLVIVLFIFSVLFAHTFIETYNDYSNRRYYILNESVGEQPHYLENNPQNKQ